MFDFSFKCFIFNLFRQTSVDFISHDVKIIISLSVSARILISLLPRSCCICVLSLCLKKKVALDLKLLSKLLFAHKLPKMFVTYDNAHT